VAGRGQGVQRAVAFGLLPIAVGLFGATIDMAARDPSTLVQHVVNGLTLGGLFALIALGYTMVYGIIELINFAHGEVFMVGSFLGLIALSALAALGVTSVWIAPPLALLFAMLGCAALGVALDSVAYKPLRRRPTRSAVVAGALSVAGLWLVMRGGADPFTALRALGFVGLAGFAVAAFALDEKNPSPPRSVPRLNALLSAIGMSIFLQNMVMLAVGRDTKTFPQTETFTGLPTGPDGPRVYFDLLGARVQYVELLTLLSAIALMITLDLWVTRTKLGKAMRAIAQDTEAAMMLGIPVNRVITTTFVVGSALAAAAGMLYGLRYGGIKFNDGFLVGLKAFIAAVLGGIGNLRGAMLGGFVLGVSETVLVATLEHAWNGLGALLGRDEWPAGEFHDYKDAIAFIVLVVVLTLRPSGLLGQKVAEKV
jgi:branched-chain amino acid transport system permease protein